MLLPENIARFVCGRIEDGSDRQTPPRGPYDGAKERYIPDIEGERLTETAAEAVKDQS